MFATQVARTNCNPTYDKICGTAMVFLFRLMVTSKRYFDEVNLQWIQCGSNMCALCYLVRVWTVLPDNLDSVMAMMIRGHSLGWYYFPGPTSSILCLPQNVSIGLAFLLKMIQYFMYMSATLRFLSTIFLLRSLCDACELFNRVRLQ